MEIEVLSKKQNPLLKRTEVAFRITHPKEKTPARSAVREKLAQLTGGKPDAVIVMRLMSRFGRAVSEGTAKVYESVEIAKSTEVPHILIRHGLKEKVAKVGAPAKEAPKPAPAREAPKAAAPAKEAPKDAPKPTAPAKESHKEEKKPAAAKEAPKDDKKAAPAKAEKKGA